MEKKIREVLVGKGQKVVEQYFRNRGYMNGWCVEETEDECKVEYAFNAAGICARIVTVTFSKKLRCKDVEVREF